MKSASDRLRIAVLGSIVRLPLGGLAWHHAQFVLGLARMGHDVYFFEDSDDHLWPCYDPSTGITGTEPGYGLKFADSFFSRLGLADRWAYYDAHTSQWMGSAASKAIGIFGSADLLLNLSGMNPLREWSGSVPVRVLVDTDPVFNQVRHLTDPAARKASSLHTDFFTFAENIGTPQGKVPDDGFPWKPTRQPVVLDAWPVTDPPPAAKFTTVMQWESYPDVEYGGDRYGTKSHSFGPYLDLPSRVGPVLELALGTPDAPRGELAARGWSLCDPLRVTLDPWLYQSYIQGSKAEFSVAKHGYHATNCGWFSERSAVYLASGRPVVVQDTGFCDWLDAPGGLLSFRSPEQAVSAINEVRRNYDFHSRAARAVAEEFFESGKVLDSLLRRINMETV